MFVLNADFSSSFADWDSLSFIRRSTISSIRPFGGTIIELEDNDAPIAEAPVGLFNIDMNYSYS